MTESPYLIGPPAALHRYWWTCFPALPTNQESHHYHSLKRVWFDPTMNIVRRADGGGFKSGARGSYRERSEDFLTPFLFQTWALFGEEPAWVPRFLGLFGIEPVGKVSKASWCYLFEQPHSGRQICIADVVFSWRDEGGEAVLVLEAKVKGGKLSSKDVNDPDRYLRMPSIAAVERRWLAFLVDDADAEPVHHQIHGRFPVGTWQAMVRTQLDAATSLITEPEISREIAAAIVWNARSAGLDYPAESAGELRFVIGAGNSSSYDRIKALSATADEIAYLLGTEVRKTCANGRMPEPPFEWLASEPDVLTACDPQSPTRQKTVDRQVARWRVGWRAPNSGA